MQLYLILAVYVDITEASPENPVTLECIGSQQPIEWKSSDGLLAENQTSYNIESSIDVGNYYCIDGSLNQTDFVAFSKFFMTL